MPYIGNQPAEQFTSFATQTFSVSATTSYTLDHAVTNENEIALFVNNVRQQPGSGKAYTATGTALTLSAATASTDTMYCVFLGRALQTVNPAGGSVGSSQLSADAITGQTALTSAPASTDELLISDAGVLKRIDVSLIGGDMTPAFYGELASNTTISRNSYVKVTGMTQNEIDTDSAFDGTTFTVPSGEGGKYFLYASCVHDFELAGDDGEEGRCIIYKNGSEIKESKYRIVSEKHVRYVSLNVNMVVTLSASDTIELYTYSKDNSGADARVLSTGTSIGGYKLIGV